MEIGKFDDSIEKELRNKINEHFFNKNAQKSYDRVDVVNRFCDNKITAVMIHSNGKKETRKF